MLRVWVNILFMSLFCFGSHLDIFITANERNKKLSEKEARMVGGWGAEHEAGGKG
jgi:hypothetical protein